MENYELENEIELRMNPEDFSLSSGDLIEIMNMFELNESDVAFAYSKIVADKREDLIDTTKEVMNIFRTKGYYYPSFNEFKRAFSKYEGETSVDDNILRKMQDNEMKDKDQISMFEVKKMIQEELGSMWTDFDSNEFEDEAKTAAMQDIGGEFEELGDNKYEKNINPEEFIGDIDRVRLELPSDEDEFDKISKMMTKKKSHEDLFGAGSMNEDEMEIGQKGLFRPQDANGNDISKMALVKSANSEIDKKGRVTGFGDDGKGNQVIIVDYQWPTDLKFMSPEEMGEKREYPQDIIVQGTEVNENTTEMNKEINEDKPKLKMGRKTIPGVNDGTEDEKNTKKSKLKMGRKDIDGVDETVEESRGLSHTVKNNGDRSVKKDNKDHSHTPVTTLDERIKTLSEGKLKKKDLLNFINEQAKKFADDIKKEKK